MIVKKDRGVKDFPICVCIKVNTRIVSLTEKGITIGRTEIDIVGSGGMVRNMERGSGGERREIFIRDSGGWVDRRVVARMYG